MCINRVQHECGGITQYRLQRIQLPANHGAKNLPQFGGITDIRVVLALRVLQEGEVTKVGASQPNKIDVRIIAATHRNLIDDIVTGLFREDLFYRLAVAILKSPPLNEREGDLGFNRWHCG